MKKLISAILVLSLSLSLAACGQEEKTETVGSLETEPAAETFKETEEMQQEQTIEITLDNYQKYFELREAAEPYMGEDGTIESWDFFYGVFLKESYLDRFQSGHVDFEAAFETELREISMEEGSDTYKIGNLLAGESENGYEQKTCGTQDFRNMEGISEKSDFYGTIAAQAYCGSIQEAEDGSFMAILPVGGDILNAEGTLTLK